MNTLEAITTRPEHPQVQDKLVNHDTIEQIVSAAAYAPSWKNTQVVRYHVLENKALQKKIAEEYTLNFVYNNTGTLGVRSESWC